MFNSDLGFQFGGSGLTPLPDDEDFLALLGNPKALPSTTTANPADLSVLRNINLSPTSSESSPSPPNHTQSGPTTTGSGADLDTNQAANIHDIFSNIPSMASRATRSANRDPLTGEPSAKRKTLDDLDEESDEDAPQRKFQHTDASGNKKTATKRKSIGGQDDNRLQKRKEQNRAAQRAFRERKERHVKDLEDKVSMLEAKTDSQAAENENLRELLTRLQQENLQLKQNQFSFTFQQPVPSTSANPNRTQPYPAAAARQTSSDTNMAGPKATPNSSSSSSQSPLNERSHSNSMSNGLLNGSASTPQLTNSSGSPADFNLLETLGLGNSTPDLNFSSAGGLTGLTPPSSNNNSFTLLDSSFFGSSTPSNSNNNNGSDLSAFGDLGGFQPLPYQTIAASPMFTSYRDPTANPNAWSFGPNSSQSLALNTYDELFGGAGPASLSMSGLPSAGGDSTMTSAMDDLMPFSFMPDLSNGTGGSQFGGLSPISHLPTPPSATTAVGSTGSSTSGNAVTTPVQTQPSDIDMKIHDGKDCPKTKEEMANIIQQMGTGTFGPPVEGVETDLPPEATKAMADEPVCDKMRLADSTKLNLDIGTAWRAVRQHPQFEECDIDELCADLAKKATCDGNTKVIEAQKIMDIVHSIPERAKQRKLSMATRSLMQA